MIDIDRMLSRRETKLEEVKKEGPSTYFVNGVEIVRGSGLPTIIIDDRDPNFTLAIIPWLVTLPLGRLREIKSPEIEPEKNWTDEPPGAGFGC